MFLSNLSVLTALDLAPQHLEQYCIGPLNHVDFILCFTVGTFPYPFPVPPHLAFPTVQMSSAGVKWLAPEPLACAESEARGDFWIMPPTKETTMMGSPI